MIWGAQNKNNITIQNGTLQGDRMIHNYINYEVEEGKKPTSWQSSVTHEHGLGVYIRACSNVLVKNMEIYDFTGDSLTFNNSLGSVINETNA